MYLLTILTDERVIAGFCTLLTLMGTGFFMAVRWIIVKVLKESQESRVLMAGFTQALNDKFSALNELAIKSDKRHALQQQKLYNLSAGHDEYKKRVDQHENTLTQHDVKISHIEKTVYRK